jgi:RND family efflux transporter MFP subunit
LPKAAAPARRRRRIMSADRPVSKPRRFLLLGLLVIAGAGAALWGLRAPRTAPAPAGEAPAGAAKPALSVALTSPSQAAWPRVLAAAGDIAAWQEALIGAEISNYRITEVLVNVGDRVRKGQILARISADTVAAEVAQTQAQVAEAEASLAEAKANAERARQLVAAGFYSSQQATQSLTAEQTAAARLNAARARLKVDELRLARTRVLAPDDGVVSARAAAVGALAQPGVELFRLIRGGRLEWRAELPEAELARLKAGTPALLTTPDGSQVKGRARETAPTIDPKTRNGLVYVDLGTAPGLRAGMFARGEFQLGAAPALTLPQSAVLLRDGYAYVFRVEAKDKVAQTKVSVGRRLGERVEITAGLDAAARVVESGVGFLSDGDTVRIVPTR